MIEMRESPDSDIIELTIDGHVTAKDYHELAERFLAAYEKHGKIRVLKEIRSINGVDFEVLKEKLILALVKHIKDVKCGALVTDEHWLEQLTDFLKPAYPCPVRCFKLNQIEEARQWLRSQA